MIILNFMWTWKNYEYLSWCMKRPTIFMWLRSIKGFRGLSLLMKWEGWIGKIFSVRWAWGKMRSVFYITWPLTLLMHLLAEENKAIHFIQGSAQLPLDHSAFNWFEYYSHCDVVSIDEEEVVPRKLKKSTKQTENVASKEVQQVKERCHLSFSFMIFYISVPNHGVHLEHKMLLWRIFWLLLKISS